MLRTLQYKLCCVCVSFFFAMFIVVSIYSFNVSRGVCSMNVCEFLLINFALCLYHPVQYFNRWTDERNIWNNNKKKKHFYCATQLLIMKWCHVGSNTHIVSYHTVGIETKSSTKKQSKMYGQKRHIDQTEKQIHKRCTQTQRHIYKL